MNVRIEVHLSQDAAKTLSDLARLDGRSRKKFCELILMAVVDNKLRKPQSLMLTTGPAISARPSKTSMP